MKPTSAIGPLLVRSPRLMRLALRAYGRANGCAVVFSRDQVAVQSGGRTILLGADRAPYVRDLVTDFDHYFGAVQVTSDDPPTVDFRTVREHSVTGWPLTPLLLPGLPEPMETADQYIELTQPEPGQTVLDLGAYAGLTSMVFCEAVGSEGRVIAVEADPTNAECARSNLARYRSVRGYGADLVEAAVWSQSGRIEFVAEAALGSAVAEVLPRAQGATVSVPTLTLSDLVAQFGLQAVDIIKADIEGAELRALSDRAFFREFHPTIVFEPAATQLRETQLQPISDLLRGYGYTLTTRAQQGSRLPLVLCV